MGQCLSSFRDLLPLGRSARPSIVQLPSAEEVDSTLHGHGKGKKNKKGPESGLCNGSNASSAHLESVATRLARKPLPPLPPPKDGLIVRAQYDFPAVNEDELSFKNGDRLKVDESTLDSEWWMATHLATKETGYIPSNYVCVDDNSPQAQDWWFDSNRQEADLMLLLPGNSNGTFLVREAHDKTSYVLSVRQEFINIGDPMVRHYRIRKLDNGGFYISAKKQFADLLELIDFYSSDEGKGLCTRLTVPCPRLRPFQMRFDQLEIEKSAITLENKVGAGQFGVVYKAKLNKTVDVAVKTLKKDHMEPAEFLREAKIMHQMRHKKLVNLLAVCTCSEPIYIVTEFMVNGSLLDYLRKDETKNAVKFPMLIKMAAQIADGMQYLEAKNFIHRDLRAANILVGEHHDVKVADFGLARILQDEEYYDASGSVEVKFPIKWTAPEAGLQRKFSVKSDVWSFGVLLYEILTYGRIPYPGFIGNVLLKVNKGYRMENPAEEGRIVCPDDIYKVMLNCWHQQPADRPTFQFLKVFFEDYQLDPEEQYSDLT